MKREASNGNPTSAVDTVPEMGRMRFEWTRSGLIFAGLAAALLGVGIWRVDGEMAAMGLAASVLLLLVWVFGRMNLKGLVLEYRGPQRVEAGKRFQGEICVRNKRRFLDVFWVEFGIRLNGEKELSARVNWLESGGSATISKRVSLKKRNLQIEQRGWVRSIFPLGLMRFERLVSVEGETGVLPRTKVPEELQFSGFLNDGPPMGSSKQFGGIGEWKGLTEWRGGDSMKKIAWAASLKSEMSGGGLLVRRYEPPGSQVESCVVVFHSLGGEGNLIRPDRFEKSLSLLSGVASYLCGWGVPIELIADFRSWERLEIRNKSQLAGFREELILAERVGWTEVHDLRSSFSGVKKNQCLVVISDMPAKAWEGILPDLPLEPVVVDIERYYRKKRRRFLTGKEANQ
ncbi:MAG: DUF58 domain-containing protein [Akkermansiaceae bacterium]